MNGRKLSDGEIKVVRRLYASGISVRSIAKDFNTSSERINSVCDRASRMETTMLICRECGRQFEVTYERGVDNPGMVCNDCLIMAGFRAGGTCAELHPERTI